MNRPLSRYHSHFERPVAAVLLVRLSWNKERDLSLDFSTHMMRLEANWAKGRGGVGGSKASTAENCTCFHAGESNLACSPMPSLHSLMREESM